MAEKITIIIPTYNEGEIIRSLLEAVLEEVSKIKKYHFTILIIDGGSTDNTIKEIEEIRKKNQNIHFLIEKKKGLGNAYTLGISHAINILNCDAFIEFDGDFQHNPKDIYKFIEKLDEGYEYVIGSRYIKGGSIPKEWPWYRKFLSLGGNTIIRKILKLDILDATSGFKLTKIKSHQTKLPIKINELISLRHAYKIHYLYTMIKSGAKTTEVPIEFLNRNKGISKSTWEDIKESLKVIIILKLRELRKK